MRLMTRPKLDAPHKDEAEEEGEYSDDDFYIKLCPRDYESGELVQLCESALAHYHSKNPGESYKFESGQGGNYYFNLASTYNLEFCAKKTDDNFVQNFKVTALYHYHDPDEPEEFQVIICFKLKDGEAELPLDYSVERDLEISQGKPNLLNEPLEEKEYAKIVEFSKSALTIYNENSGEIYEFVEIKDARRYVYRGYEYVLEFTANKKDERISSTFKAYCRHLTPAFEIWSCSSY